LIGLEAEFLCNSLSGAEAPKVGEIVARGANVMLGYWNHLECTARVFRNNFLRAGDIGYQDTAGYLFIVDRLKDSHR
jgi:long-chain acyl-CoA synthetase